MAQFFLFGGKDHVASAEIAGTSAKRQMDIERELLFARLKKAEIVIISEIITEFQSSRIGGIPGTGPGVFAEFFKIDGAQKVSF